MDGRVCARTRARKCVCIFFGSLYLSQQYTILAMFNKQQHLNMMITCYSTQIFTIIRQTIIRLIVVDGVDCIDSKNYTNTYI